MKTMFALSALVAALVSFNAEAATCREGQEALWETQNSGEGSTREIFICKGGRFVPKYRAEDEYIRNPRSTCRNGEEYLWETQNGGEGSTRELFVCKNGRFVPKFGKAP